MMNGSTLPIRSALTTRFAAVLSQAVVVTTLAVSAVAAGAQMQMPAQGNGKPPLSPPAEARVMLEGKTLAIKYSAPSMRGRVIMGGLVPYGQVWRTGANEATSLVTELPLKIGDLSVPAGSYTLYTMPAAPGKPWQLIVNKQTGQWGTVYKQDMDLGRTPLKHDEISAPQELMSISFEKTGKHSTELHIKWEKADEWVKIEAK
ncbi:DUF2911 domain-containing protein [Bryocella elongata]|nr:DUF2911 domain-containing protein [Bryocella elongata]